ncbi:MAG: PAS domain S-box protein [Syntrophobacteraceae bacterium]|nr:PAS domain S-box protein [Syntrophobacteraceae bacterium]
MKQSRILVVEDEAIVTMEIEQRLTAMGYLVAAVASSGEQALRLAGEKRPDLVLMDIGLDGDMDGISAAEKIRSRFHVPTIFLTAYSEDSTLERAKRAEPCGFLLKPFDDRELKAAIEIALHKHRTEEELRRMNRLYNVLSQVNQTIVRAESREQLLDIVCRLLVERGDMDLAWVGCLEPGSSHIHPVASHGDCEIIGEPNFFSTSPIEAQSNPGMAILKGEPYICNECGKSPCPYPSEKAPQRFGFKSCASFPLWFQEEVFGALTICVQERGFFRAKEIDLLKEVAADISFALDKIEGDARRSLAEKSLAAGEERLRLFIEHAPAALAMFDRQMRYLSVSRRWLSLYNLGERDVVGLSHYEVFPEITETWKRVHRRGLSGEVVRAADDRFVRADGSAHWLRWEVRPWLDANGDIGGIVIFTEDISERKRAEESLRESEERYRLAMEATSDGLWDWDLVTGDIYYSPGYFRMLGYEPGEFPGISGAWVDLIHPEDRRDVLAANEACIRNDSPSFSVEFRMRSRDGAWRWILGRGKAVRRDTEGLALQVIGTYVDITERKLREKELEKLHRHNESILNAAGEGIVGLDDKGKITFVNPAALKILGYEAIELTGFSLHALAHHHKADGSLYPEKECPTHATLKEGVPVRIQDEVLWKKDSTPFPAAYSATPIVYDGKISGAVITFRDITVRKEALDALRESEVKYRNIFENAVEGIFQTTPGGRYLSVNPALANMCGFQSPGDMVSSIEDIASQLYIDPEERSALKALLDTEGIAKKFETRFRRTDSRVLWVSINARAIRDEQGNLRCYEGTVEDISERRQHERELEMAVDFLRLMQEAGDRQDMVQTSIAFFKERLDCEAVGIRLREGEDYPYFESTGFAPGFILAENSLCTRGEMGEVARDGDGYPAHACMCGNVIRGRFDPSKPFFTENGSFWTNNTTQLLATTSEADRKARTRNRCNGEGYESVALIALRAGAEPIGLLQINDRRKERFSCEDIALCERLAGFLAVALAKFDYQDKLRESEEQFKTMFEMASIGITQTDPKTRRWVRVNQKMCEITGYSSDELLGMHVEELTYPEDREMDKVEFENLISGKSPIFHVEKRYVRKDGEPIWVNVNGALIRDSAGQPVKTVTTIEDITERKRLAEEQALAEAQLRQAQKLEALGTLAGGVAHDFNNILSIIMGYAELSKMETEPGSAMGENLQEILTASTRAKELVQQILAFSRRSEYQKLSLRLDTIVKDAMKILRPSLPSTIEIKTEGFSNSEVFADPTQMHQVLMNLCTNASHAMREKGGVLRVGLRDIALEAEDTRSFTVKPGRYVELRVKDTGHGIDPRIIDSIFDPFFTTKKLGEGTGLGLSVVHGIVKGHGGAITVESMVDGGTAFTVLIPALEAANELKKEETAPPFSRGKERILVVDDEPSLAEMVRTMLSRFGYDAVSCTSATEALNIFRDRLEDKPFDLVVTDMTMPRLTGEDLAREISRLRPEVPVILMTGFSEKIDAEKAKWLGIRGFLMKPVVLNSLAALIRKLLEGAN